MNKLFSKIAGLSIGLAMAIGVGVAVGSNKEAKVASAADQTDSLTASLFTATSTTYTAFSGVSATSDAVYAGKTAKTSSGGIQIRSKSSDTGIITTGSGGKLKSISIVIESGSNTIDFYGKTSAYSAVGDLYGSNKGTKIGSASATGSVTLTNPENYTYLGIRSNNGACYITSISVTWTSGDTKTLSSIAVKTAPTKTTYYEGQTFNPTGLVITGTYSDQSTEDISYAQHSSDFTFTPSTSTALTTSNKSVTIGYGEKTCSQSITVNADVLNSVVVSGTMSTTSYTTADSWVKTGLVVTANYAGQGSVNVTSSATIVFYKDNSMTQEVATPNDLGVGQSQAIYVKATYSGVSNATGYSQTVSVTKAPSVQTATINLSDITLNDNHSQNSTDVSITKGAVTFAWTKVSGSVAANSYIGGYNNRTQSRIYTGHRLTIYANGNTLKCVNFTGATGANNGPNKMATWTGGTLSEYDTSAGTATVTAGNSITSLVCTPTANTYLFSAEVQFYASDVPAEGITINGETSSSVSITPYQTTRLVASVLPIDATDRTFEWSLNPSDDNAIITIDETGHVEPISGKYGATIVTATSNDGGFTATCTVTVEHVSYYQAVYNPTSTSTASTSGTLPDGESHTFSCGNYQTGYAQITTNAPTVTLTLSGYNGQKIRAVLLKMHSNGSAGTGALSIVAGSTTVASIASATFSDESWNGEYTTDWVLIEPEFTQYDVKSGEDIVITVTASVNSLYLSEVRVQYEPSEVDTSAVDFAQLILDDISCNAQGTSAPSSSEWLALEELWDDGTTVTAAGKQTLLDAQAVEHENPSTDEEIIQAAMAKYDYIIGKYNKAQGLTTQYPDFIERNPSPVGNSKVILSILTGSNSVTTITVIIAISAVSLAAIGGYFLFRKKKED